MPNNQMLNVVGTLSLALACRYKTGGVIVNEHTLDEKETRRHVEVLSRWFDFIHLNELPEHLSGRKKRPFCLLTFDDGKRSNATAVAPELQKLGVPAVFFVVTNSVGGKTPLWFDLQRALRRKLGTVPPDLRLDVLKQLPYAVLLNRLKRACLQSGVEADWNDDDVALMNWEQVRGLHKRGFSIGAHGITHAILPRETKAEALENIEKSLARVQEEIGEPCTSFAFPNGNYTAELAQHAICRGAKMVMTTDPTWADRKSPLWRLPRLQLFRADSSGKIELKIALAASGLFLNNPDGSGKAYRGINRVARCASSSAKSGQIGQLPPNRRPQVET